MTPGELLQEIESQGGKLVARDDGTLYCDHIPIELRPDLMALKSEIIALLRRRSVANMGARDLVEYVERYGGTFELRDATKYPPVIDVELPRELVDLWDLIEPKAHPISGILEMRLHPDWKTYCRPPELRETEQQDLAGRLHKNGIRGANVLCACGHRHDLHVAVGTKLQLSEFRYIIARSAFCAVPRCDCQEFLGSLPRRPRAKASSANRVTNNTLCSVCQHRRDSHCYEGEKHFNDIGGAYSCVVPHCKYRECKCPVFVKPVTKRRA
jgi:hypothetical protein